MITQSRHQLKRGLSPSLVYPFLEQLEANGYLTHTTGLIGEKQRKTYHLTPKGQTFCRTLFKQFSEIVLPSLKPRRTQFF
ncbi:MAG: PadR family transcriptional regulator [Nitrososphaerota archaeon]|nr:PadR family transcriptional regulator [Nitrososphaerota archaeon]